ncbi:protein TolQ [SAR86 cluster bacterium]|jgi:biopolymer transport protein TolQ|nr:protein TolQ [SAR86 cluster bacterium]MDC3059798.1 protein TolQ [SAR86 cluster bacterium]MEC8146692.1 protein TolQ [Pseudomonadota bacterium]
MTDYFSIYSLILNASIVVQLVIGILLLASIGSWVVIVEKWIVTNNALKEFFLFEQFFWSGESLKDIYDDLKAKEDLVGIESIFYEIYEDSIAQDSQELQKDDLTARFKRVSKVSLMRQEDLLESRISFLSTVASASPYIGLFGTVWGIMNSFRGLAQTSQATLSVVAPGISEALIATALGLFAAIPALIAYNFFVKRINTILNRYESFIEEFQNLLAR